MSAATDLLALLDSDPAAGILAAADLREARAKELLLGQPAPVRDDARSTVAEALFDEANEHEDGWGGGLPFWTEVAIAAVEALTPILAEANPAHALAAVRRWRGVVERHHHDTGLNPPGCYTCGEDWPCPDLTETADEARAYLGGAS